MLFNHALPHLGPHFSLSGGVPSPLYPAIADLCLLSMVYQRDNLVIVWSAVTALTMLCQCTPSAVKSVEGWGKSKAGGDSDDDDMMEEDPNQSISYVQERSE